jgi:hypothetical protein
MSAGRNDHYYRVLGVDSSVSPEELKRAHCDLVQVWHPDRFTANPRLQKLAQEKLLEINAAYDALRFHTPADPVEAPPAPASASAQPSIGHLPRKWFQLPAQAAGVAIVIFALIMSGRGIHRLLTEPSPSRPTITTLAEPDDPPAPRQSARRNSVTPTADYVANGEEIIEPRGRTGVGRLTVTNQTEQDAVAAVVDHATGAKLRMVYVSAGMQTNIDGIAPGIYRLSLDSGSEWSRGTRAFKQNRTVPRSIGPFTFTQVQTAGQLRGDQYSIVLRQDTTVGSEMSHAGM